LLSAVYHWLPNIAAGHLLDFAVKHSLRSWRKSKRFNEARIRHRSSTVWETAAKAALCVNGRTEFRPGDSPKGFTIRPRPNTALHPFSAFRRFPIAG
jgi:hypothetical protein